MLFLATGIDLRRRSSVRHRAVGRRKLNEARCAGLADGLLLDLDGLRLARLAATDRAPADRVAADPARPERPVVGSHAMGTARLERCDFGAPKCPRV